ncbi:MAG: hypothetical protein PQJ58_11890, partial [Spirochaetales bacterium]|nr:hypothetical protein [Spirochaetales bacterium]
ILISFGNLSGSSVQSGSVARSRSGGSSSGSISSGLGGISGGSSGSSSGSSGSSKDKEEVPRKDKDHDPYD